MPFRFTQAGWRKAGGVCIGVAGLMAWFGVDAESLRSSVLIFGLYWALFLIFFCTAIALVLLDLRYIRLQYSLGKRAIFEETLGDEEFRRRLKAELRDHDGPPSPKT
jgi:hypothetical protein